MREAKSGQILIRVNIDRKNNSITCSPVYNKDARYFK